VEKHVTALGVLDLAVGLSGLVGAPFVLFSLVGGWLATGRAEQMLFMPAMGVGITLLILLFSIPTLVAGIGLLRGATWARPVGLFAAAMNLVSFPIGTPVGAYGLWVLAKTAPERRPVANT
jgi:hypothetical protein